MLKNCGNFFPNIAFDGTNVQLHFSCQIITAIGRNICLSYLSKKTIWSENNTVQTLLAFYVLYFQQILLASVLSTTKTLYISMTMIL